MTGSREPLSPCVSFLKEHQSDCVHCTIRGSALFADIDVAELDQRLKTVRNGVVRANTVIYRQGEPAVTVFTIRSGVVKLVTEDTDSLPRVLRMLGRGSAVGLESLDGGVYEQTAVAMRDLNLCRIPKATLVNLGNRHPSLLNGIVRKWREHVYWSERWITTLCTGKQSERVPSLICLIAEISGDPLSAVRLPRSSEMADILGCSVEGVSRRMARLKRKGLLKRVAPWTYSCEPDLLAKARPTSLCEI
jgi:CRP-like cAMP-binding protein